MQVLAQCLRAALLDAWCSRGKFLWLLATIWLPANAFVFAVPKSGQPLMKLFVDGIAGTLWYGALIYLARANVGQFPMSAGQALRRSRRRFPRLFGLHNVLGARMIVGFIALLVPGLVMFVNYSMLDVLGVCENVGPTECRERSTTIVGRHWKAVAAFLTCYYALEAGAGALAEWVVQSLSSSEEPSLGSRLIPIVAYTAVAAFTAIQPLTLFELYRRETQAVSFKPL